MKRAATPHRRTRANLWDLSPRFLCQIVGSCLPEEQLRDLARAHLPLVDGQDLYAMHIEAVGRAVFRNRASEAMQDIFDRRFAAAVERYASAADDEAIVALWREDQEHGEAAGALWAAMTHPAVSNGCRNAIHGDMHMLSHRLAAAHENRALQPRLHTPQNERRGSALEARIRDLKSANDVLHLTAQRAWALEKTLRAAHEELEQLARERDQLAAERDALRQRLAPATSRATSPEKCSGACDACPPDSRQRCVLFVGGSAPQMRHYSDLAARLGIRLVYHDGGQEEPLSRLPDMIGQVDAVVCPSKSVSHTACHQVKRHCRQVGKPCLLYRGGGLPGFAAALARIAAHDPASAATEIEAP